MPVVQELPTEILCSIFELSTSELISVATQDTRQSQQRPPAPIDSTSATVDMAGTPAADTVGFCALPSQKDYFLHCVTLSHVCSRWRYVAIDLHSLWTRIYLGCNAFVADDSDDTKAADTTSRFLSRSADLLICLDITFTPGNSSVHLSSKSISQALLPHVARFQSLRLIGNELLITAVLDVFLERNLDPSNDVPYTPLSHLHISKSQSRTIEDTWDNADAIEPFFPPDLSIVGPHLSVLHVDGVQIGAFPRWRLEYVVLTDTSLSFRNHFHLLANTRTRKLVLHRIIIPTGGPYVRHLQAHENTSSVTSLSFSDLRCVGREDQRKDMYRTFFALSLHNNLQELEVSSLSQEGMSGFIATLAVNPVVALNDLHRLVLRGVKVNGHAVGVMANAFPSVRNMELFDVEGSLKLVHIWRRHIAIWLQLTEIIVDGEIVGRNA